MFGVRRLVVTHITVPRFKKDTTALKELDFTRVMAAQPMQEQAAESDGPVGKDAGVV